MKESDVTCTEDKTIRYATQGPNNPPALIRLGNVLIKGIPGQRNGFTVEVNGKPVGVRNVRIEGGVEKAWTVALEMMPRDDDGAPYIG